MDVSEVLLGDPVALAVHDVVLAAVRETGPVEVRLSATQVTFRRSRGFAYLWVPGRWVRSDVPVVLSIVLGRRDPSPRWKEVAHPSPRHWVHHLELWSAAELDPEVRAWLAEAAERA